MRCWMYAACALIAIAQVARADIIIDDFDDSAIVTGPVAGMDKVADTSAVGTLKLDRRIRIFSSRGITDAQIDSNVSIDSHLSAQMTSITPLTPADTPIVALSIRYLVPFPGLVDLSEDGHNDTLFLDFQSLAGETPPPHVHLLLGELDDQLSYEYFYFPVKVSQSPFTVAIPFNDFRPRGGGTLIPSFRDVFSLNIHFLANGFFGAPEELGWTAVLDRVRVGVVPEPNALVLLIIGLLLFPRRLR